MNVYKGTILTCDDQDTVARYLVEEEGHITFVGNQLPQRYNGAPVTDLGSSALCPSFVDTHEHLASFATFHAGLNVMDATSNRQIMQMISEFTKNSDAKTLIAFGASPYSVVERRLLSREEMDQVCPDRPMMMVKYDGHACVVNSKLLEQLQAKLTGLRGFHPDSGEMNQEAFFAVSDYITGSLSLPQLVGNIQRAMDYLATKGIGMVHTVSGVGFAGDMDISLERWVGRSAQHGFQVRVFPQSMDVNVALKRHLPRIGGCFACALDGCFGSRDAALLQPYMNPDNATATLDNPQGILYYTDQQVTDFCKAANRAGLQIEMHAIGDAAFNQATRALRAALEDLPRDDHRHGVIHACLPTQEGLEICRDYHLHLPMQTAFIGWPQEPDEYLEAILGQQRAARLNPLRTMWDMGITISAGSDAPCTDPDPVMWMQRACNHSNPAESLNIHEALRMCTRNGAWTTFDDVDRGTLEVGKVADMVRLSGNPYATPVEHIDSLKVEELLLGDVAYTPQDRSVVGAVLAGMTGKARI